MPKGLARHSVQGGGTIVRVDPVRLWPWDSKLCRAGMMERVTKDLP